MSGLRTQAGFTLIELLIVVAMLAMVSAAAMLSVPSSADRQLQEEGRRLVTLIEIARAQSRASGLPVSLFVDTQGFRFEGAKVLDSASGSWLHPQTTAQVKRLLLGPEPVIAAQSLQLYGVQGRRLLLASDGVKPFAFEMQAP